MLSSLFDGDFDTYFAQAGQPTPLWLFVHVPKTAGSSLQADMARLLTPQTNIAIDYSDKSDTTYKARFEAAVDRFLAQHARVPYRFASGHLKACNTEIIRDAVPDLRAFTMLRDPILRLVSDYRYQRSGLNVAREDFIARTPDFAAYVARPYVHNKTAIALVPREMVSAGDAAAAVDYVMKNYCFVGLQAMYSSCFQVLTTLIGHPRAAAAKIRVNPPSEANKLDLTWDEERELPSLNAMDVALFSAFAQKWQAISDDVQNYLADRGRRAA